MSISSKGLKIRPAIEWPTIGLLVLVYGGWLAITYFSALLPWFLVAPLGAVLITWHSSLQHEILHGHPTKWRSINRALAIPPLSLWLPYELYRRSHLIHHRDERLTDPLDDPESYYWTRSDWQQFGTVRRSIIRFQTTFLGRLVIGPAWNISRFVGNEFLALAKGDFRHLGIWIRHAIGVTCVLLWISFVADMSIAFYIFAIVYPGTAILLIRSFAEHRAHDDVQERTALVENAPILGLLFLYNNLHAAHHAEPMMAWYEIPSWYQANRDRLIQENGGLLYNGYFDVARRFFLKAHHEPEHPKNRAPFADGRLPGM